MNRDAGDESDVLAPELKQLAVTERPSNGRKQRPLSSSIEVGGASHWKGTVPRDVLFRGLSPA